MVGRRAPTRPGAAAPPVTAADEATGGPSDADTVLEPYQQRDSLDAEAQTTQMHSAELAALAEYDEARAQDTEVTGPPDNPHTEARPPAPTIPWGGSVNGPTGPTERAEDRPPLATPAAVRAAIALAITFAAGVGVGAWVWSRTKPAVIDTAAVPSSPTAAPSVSSGPLDAVRSGAPEALEAMVQKSRLDRTADETLALAEGRARTKLHALELLAAELEAPDASFAKRGRLIDFIRDRETTTEAARVAAGLPGSLGPDILYEVWVGTRERNETTMLAEELVYSTTVRRNASEALAVALDLRLAESCEDYLTVLPRAAKHADRRSLHLLGELRKKVGCGPRKASDCYPCIRPLDDDPNAPGLTEALETAKRPAPRLR